MVAPLDLILDDNDGPGVIFRYNIDVEVARLPLALGLTED